MKNQIPYTLLMAAIVGLAVAVRLLDPAPLERVRLIYFDTLQNLSPRAFDASLPVKIVDIDDASLREFGQWPWPRALMADLVERLTAAGAAVIAFDVVFPEPERTVLAEILPMLEATPDTERLVELLETLPSGDEAFAGAVGGSVTVMGVVGTAEPTGEGVTPKASFAFAGDDPSLFVPTYDGLLASVPAVHDPAGGAGALNWVPEHDQVVRKVPLVLNMAGALYPTLSVEALRLAQGASTIVVRASNSSHEEAFGRETGISRIRVGQFEVPTDANGQMWLHFTRHQPARYVSAAAVLRGEMPPGAVEGQIVLIGTSASGLLDLQATPLDAAIPGVEIHAQVIEQILVGETLVRPDYATGLELVLLVVLGGLLAAFVASAGAATGALVGAGVSAAVVGGSLFAFLDRGLLLDASYLVIALTLIYLIGTAYSYLVTERERNQIRRVFSHYMAPELVAQLVQEPARLRLGGETREITLMFSDVRNFTPIAESYKTNPEGLTQLMNQFLSPLSHAIIERKGVIDKYMGDAIMAFWNAPLDLPDHEKLACEAALEMANRQRAFNARRRAEAEEAGRDFHPINIGIGIGTGEAVVGNMGSDIRFDYTAMGDVVNLASRLESLAAYYGVTIVVAGGTADRVVASFAVIEIDLARVKGRAAPERVHALLGDGDTERSPAFRTLRTLMGELVAAYRARAFETVLDRVEVVRAADADGQLARVLGHYEARSRALLEAPPPADWDGVWTMTEK